MTMLIFFWLAAAFDLILSLRGPMKKSKAKRTNWKALYEEQKRLTECWREWWSIRLAKFNELAVLSEQQQRKIASFKRIRVHCHQCAKEPCECKGA